MSLSQRDLARLGSKARQQVLRKMGGGKSAARSQESKYHNEPGYRLMPNGKVRKFDSAREAERYDELVQLLRSGEIRSLKLQPQYTLQESYIDTDGERVKATRYVADFSYERRTAPDVTGIVYWLPVIEDVKGVRTPEYKLKAKMMRERLGKVITEV